MAKLYFRHAVMNSGKSLALLQVNDNYMDIDEKTLLFSHELDTRFGTNVIASRLGVHAESTTVTPELNLFDHVKKIVDSGEELICILCDEAQFYTEDQIVQLSDIADFLDIVVICYGLKVSAFGELFPASKRLLELADKIEELVRVCWCTKKANMILKYDENGVVQKSGQLVEIGVESKYRSVCRKHWKLGLYKKPESK